MQFLHTSPAQRPGLLSDASGSVVISISIDGLRRRGFLLRKPSPAVIVHCCRCPSLLESPPLFSPPSLDSASIVAALTGTQFWIVSGADYSTNVVQSRVCACAQRAGTAARESLRRDCTGGLTSPMLHACGSTRPCRARCCHRNRNR